MLLLTYISIIFNDGNIFFEQTFTQLFTVNIIGRFAVRGLILK